MKNKQNQMGSEKGVSRLTLALILLLLMSIFHTALHLYFKRTAFDAGFVSENDSDYEVTLDEARDAAKEFDIDASILESE